LAAGDQANLKGMPLRYIDKIWLLQL